MDELLTDDQLNDAMEMASKGMQEGRRLLDSQFEKLFAALGLATQADLERLSRKIVKLRRRLEAVVDDVDVAAEEAAAKVQAALEKSQAAPQASAPPVPPPRSEGKS